MAVIEEAEEESEESVGATHHGRVNWTLGNTKVWRGGKKTLIARCSVLLKKSLW